MVDIAHSTLNFVHRVPRGDLAFGLLRAEPLGATPAPAPLIAELEEWIARRHDPPSGLEDERRRAARDVLRNGRYKPTGRGKPASEYLLRAVHDGFPRINGPVDATNLVSLKYLVPISIWDLDRAGGTEYELRLGHRDEEYVFNLSGQKLQLADLVCGCIVDRPGHSRPVVGPIKDSMIAKVGKRTRRVAAILYFPLAAGGESLLREATEELAGWLRRCTARTRTRTALLLPGRTAELAPPALAG